MTYSQMTYSQKVRMDEFQNHTLEADFP